MNLDVKQLYVNTLEGVNDLSTKAVEFRTKSSSSDLDDEIAPKMNLEDKNAVVELNSILDDCYQQIYNVISKVIEEEEKDSKSK